MSVFTRICSTREHDKLTKQHEATDVIFKKQQADDMQMDENLKLTKAKMKKLKTSLKTEREKVRGLTARDQQSTEG